MNFLDQRLRAANITPQRKTFTIDYWEPKAWTLAAGGEEIHVTGYRPYSGPTSPSGVTAPLYDAGMAPKPDYSGAAGKIALVQMAPAPSPEDVHLSGELIGGYPANTPVLPTGYGALAQFARVPDLNAAQQAGAVGVVYIWNNVSDGNAENQAVPFTQPPNPVPAVGLARPARRSSKPWLPQTPPPRSRCMLSCIPALQATTSGVYYRGRRMR